MKIPREFHRELWHFVTDEVLNTVPTPDSIQLAKLAGRFCRRWFGCAELPIDSESWQLVELVAYSERLGKHVGDFFSNHKEG
jgi:hypothetical protein